MTDKLGVYNNALRYLGERKLASLSENREPRRALDDEWDGTTDYCLAEGIWNFAIRAVQIDHSVAVTPAFGFSYAFLKPADWVRTHQVSSDQTFIAPLNSFNDEAGYWYANVDPLFVRYVSNDAGYGGGVAQWPAIYAEWVACRLAYKCCERITNSGSKMEQLMKMERRLKADAASKDAMDEGTISPPSGTWVRSRMGRGPSSRYLTQPR